MYRLHKMQMHEILNVPSEIISPNCVGLFDDSYHPSPRCRQDSSVMEGILCQRLPIRCLDLALVCFDFYVHVVTNLHSYSS